MTSIHPIWNHSRIFFKQLDDEGRTVEKLPRQRIEDYQLKVINATLAHVWNKNEYYRSKLEEAGFTEPKIESLEQLASVPLLKKDVIRGDKQIVLCVDPKEIGQVHHTSGTSGKAIYTSYSLADLYIYDLLPKYLEIFKESDEDVAAIALPYEFALPGLGFQRLFQFAFGTAVLSLGKGGYMAPVDKSLELMKVMDYYSVNSTSVQSRSANSHKHIKSHQTYKRRFPING
ncbi:hypothetical protein [Bacillus methanolicus]|uniref:hypothetical protein n=1 Tax=Bacillus methanolicus TaxID=1471 RepID=UPI00025F2003|nr:hypothetical protein [Bacillus methanolicus]EIJ77663.1 coenzyme f390 synthetase, putative [Bacillus methanolicus MGA3]